jgi:glycosyltransferase involved in cell wall biosynthesis
MRILFVVLGDESRASTRLRVLNLLPALESAGIEYDCISVAEFAENLPGPAALGYVTLPLLLLAKARKYDAVFLQKVPLPSLYLSLLKTQCDTLIYDFDDAIYAAPSWRDSSSKWEPLIAQTLSKSTLTITGSPVLSNYANQYCDQTVSLPTALPAEEYADVRRERDRSETGETVTLGWIGNPQNLHYLDSITDPLEQILDTYPESRLMIITAGDLPVTPLKSRSDVIYREWSLESELDSLAEADIGIRPLFDDEWTRGKGGYTSAVQTMALGIPIVVTPVSMLSDIVEHGVSGFHAETDDEWVTYLSTLISDTTKRKQMGEQAFKRVDELNFWTDKRAQEFVDVLSDLDES